MRRRKERKVERVTSSRWQEIETNVRDRRKMMFLKREIKADREKTKNDIIRRKIKTRKR